MSNRKTYRNLFRRVLTGGGLRLPSEGLIFKAIVPGLVDSIGISSITFVTGSAVDLMAARFSFDSGAVMLQLDTLEGGDVFFDSADSMAPIVRYGYEWYGILNTSFVWIGSKGIAGYSETQATKADKILKVLAPERRRFGCNPEIITADNDGTTVYAYTDQVGQSVSCKDIRTLSAVSATPHITIKSTGTECGPAVISKMISRTTAKTAAAGQIYLIGSDTSYAGNNKHDSSVIEYCDVVGSYSLDPTITPSSGLHGLEIGWNNKPSVRHSRISGCTYGIIVKGGSFDCDGDGGVIGNIITGMGGKTVAPSDGITIKGLLNIPVAHNFIYQNSTQAYGNAAIAARKESTFNGGDIFFQNNIVLLNNNSKVFLLSDGAAIKNARSNIYYANNYSTAFSGVSWPTWVAAGRVTDSDFERGSIYIRSNDVDSWQVWDEDGVFVGYFGTNPLLTHFETLWGWRIKPTSSFYRAGVVSTYVNYSLPDFWGNTKGVAAPQIGPWQGA